VSLETYFKIVVESFTNSLDYNIRFDYNTKPSLIEHNYIRLLNVFSNHSLSLGKCILSSFWIFFFFSFALSFLLSFQPSCPLRFISKFPIIGICGHMWVGTTTSDSLTWVLFANNWSIENRSTNLKAPWV
jgi:hypothetical protein